MTKAIINKTLDTLTNYDWYNALIEEVDAIITETVFNARQELLKGYHELGKRILEDRDKFEALGITGSEVVQHVAQSTGKSKRTIYYAIQFAEQYKDINELPGGKNISWHKVCNELLPKPKEACQHTEYEEVMVKVCKHCKKRIDQ